MKHILQICLLLAVCFWLLYQVKHSQEKRKEFDVKDGKVVGKVQSDGDIQRFGRKDPPRVTELTTDVEEHGDDEEEKEVEEEGEENKHEEDEPEKEDNKHEEDEPEKEDNEHEEDDPEKEDNKPEGGDGGRGVGDDEIDENETERTDAEPEHEEESVDENKEREQNEKVAEEEHHTESEEKEDLGKEDRSENEEKEDARKEDHTEIEENEDVKREDHSESDTRSDDQEHEARDAQYKADDASSEVAQDIQTHMPETGNFTTGQGSEMFGKVNFGEGNETRTSDKDYSLIQSGVIQPREDVMNNSVTSPNATATEEKKYVIDPNKSKENPQQNATLPSLQNDQTENRSNSTTNFPGEHSGASQSNGTQTELPSSLSQNTTGEGAVREGEEQTSKPDLAVVGPNKTEIVNSNTRESLNPSNTTSDQSQKTNRTDAMTAEEDSSLHAGEKSNNNGTSGSDESSLSGVVQHDPIGQSNTTALTQEERESRMDLGSMPKIRTEVQSNTAAVAE